MFCAGDELEGIPDENEGLGLVRRGVLEMRGAKGALRGAVEALLEAPGKMQRIPGHIQWTLASGTWPKVAWGQLSASHRPRFGTKWAGRGS